jgi:hypothetical protein
LSNHLTKRDPASPHVIDTAGNEVWSIGEWSATFQGQNGPPEQAKGYWASISVREGDAWKDRMVIWNVFSAPPPNLLPLPGR